MHPKEATLRLAILEAVVEKEIGQRAQETPHIVIVGCLAEVDEVDAVRTLWLGVVEQFTIVLHLATIERHIADTKITIVLFCRSRLGKGYRATFV